jgi:hypothetical protein
MAPCVVEGEGAWYDQGVSVGQAPPSIHRARRVRKLLIVELIALAAIARACVLRPATDYPGSHFNHGRNAVWLGVEWSMEPHTSEQISALAQELLAGQITTVFVYVSYLKPHGVFNSTYDHAAEFVSTLKSIAPDLDVQAWLGVPLKAPEGTPIESSYVELRDAATRTTIVDFGRFAVNELGFDGVHLDAEPMVSGEPYALILLDDLRDALGSRARLSISAREITPLFPEADLIFNRWFTWRADYYREIALRVDQIALWRTTATRRSAGCISNGCVFR